MDLSGGYLKKSLIIIIVFMALITLVLDIAIYFGLEQLFTSLTLAAEPENSKFLNHLKYANDLFISWFIPLSSIIFALSGFCLWLILKVLFNKTVNKAHIDISEQSKKKGLDPKVEQQRKQKLFLHTLSILQREGRLLDFFDEDLKNYDDEQIGMAVRSIQEDCKKAVQKYIAVKPIYDQDEGDIIELDADFDPDVVKLVGNVTGKPPFKGILKHRGWRAGKKEIPKLSEVKDAAIITPAEVEIE